MAFDHPGRRSDERNHVLRAYLVGLGMALDLLPVDREKLDGESLFWDDVDDLSDEFAEILHECESKFNHEKMRLDSREQRPGSDK
ncbi:MAG: hypothetical protein GVY13_08995 [Alphaproteobacteria bacterium]|jgi:hypothetical protein|nr:hypothetical protein [Alphaproteobacteria bacterium]